MPGDRVVSRGMTFVLTVLILSSGLMATRADVNHLPIGCTELVTDGGFEAGGQGWTEYSKLGFPLIDSFNPRSGKLGAWLGATQDNAYDRLTQPVTLPAAPASLTLSLWWSLFTQENPGGAFDTLEVQLYSSDGATRLVTLLAVNNDSAEPWVWNPISVDLLAYAGQTVQLRIVATTDQNNPTDFFVDDVSILACTTGGTATATASPSVTATSTRTSTATLTPTMTSTDAPGELTATPTSTGSVTATSTRTSTATVAPTMTSTDAPGELTATPTPTGSVTPTFTPKFGPTATPTATRTPRPMEAWLYLPLVFGR